MWGWGGCFRCVLFILFELLFDNMSTCVCVLVEQRQVALGKVSVLAGAGQSYPTHYGNNCFPIPGSFSLYQAQPRSIREP